MTPNQEYLARTIAAAEKLAALGVYTLEREHLLELVSVARSAHPADSDEEILARWQHLFETEEDTPCRDA